MVAGAAMVARAAVAAVKVASVERAAVEAMQAATVECAAIETGTSTEDWLGNSQYCQSKYCARVQSGYSDRYRRPSQNSTPPEPHHSSRSLHWCRACQGPQLLDHIPIYPRS